jgi:hypothetical protein
MLNAQKSVSPWHGLICFWKLLGRLDAVFNAMSPDARRRGGLGIGRALRCVVGSGALLLT